MEDALIVMLTAAAVCIFILWIMHNDAIKDWNEEGLNNDE